MSNILPNPIMLLFTCNITFSFSSPLIAEAISVRNNVILFFISKIAFEVIQLFELLHAVVSIFVIHFSLLLHILGAVNIHHSPVFSRKES